jgi:hypothetical protein
VLADPRASAVSLIELTNFALSIEGVILEEVPVSTSGLLRQHCDNLMSLHAKELPMQMVPNFLPAVKHACGGRVRPLNGPCLKVVTRVCNKNFPNGHGTVSPGPGLIVMKTLWTFAVFPVELPDPLRWIAHPQTVTLAAHEEFCEMVRDVGAVLQDRVAVEVPIDLACHDVWIVVTGVGLPHAHSSPQLFPVTPGKFTERALDGQPHDDDRRREDQPIHRLFEDSRH